MELLCRFDPGTDVLDAAEKVFVARQHDARVAGMVFNGIVVEIKDGDREPGDLVRRWEEAARARTPVYVLNEQRGGER